MSPNEHLTNRELFMLLVLASNQEPYVFRRYLFNDSSVDIFDITHDRLSSGSYDNLRRDTKAFLTNTQQIV